MIEKRCFNDMPVPPGYTPESYSVAINDLTSKDRRYFERYPKRRARARRAEPVEKAELGAEFIIVMKLNDVLRARYGFVEANDNILKLPQETLFRMVENFNVRATPMFNAFNEQGLEYRIVRDFQ